MRKNDYKTENTCSQVISLDLDGNTVHNVSFMGGCNGNLKAIPILNANESDTVLQISVTSKRDFSQTAVTQILEESVKYRLPKRR